MAKTNEQYITQISPATTVKGELVVENDLRLAGRLEGNLRCTGDLVLEQTGVIEGDIHESDGGFMKKVYDNSVFLADLLGWTKIECSRDGAMRPKEEIAEEVFAACGFSGRGGGAG